ncbi:glycosyltransferase family 39 protein [Streptomyces pseudovenezuelae]|uniref:ArnT family glycosyltransferase n=1 Tax=Streptomyces pseudovenezuelae TaxID=67350 RepID=UPI0034A40225
MWKYLADQPRWARPALLTVAARSMSESWKAFFYGALDPGATLTIDKLAGFLWPQALSARVFGFHTWSLTLPQVVEGVVTLLVTYRVVRRWSGPVPGLLAAAIMTLTPVLASMFGHSLEDGALTMCLVLAAGACQRAVLGARLLPLLAAGALAYLLLAAGAVTAVVSLSSVLLLTLTPAADRPCVDGTTDNSAVTMAFGYNGFNRFSGDLVEGSVGTAGAPAPVRPDGSRKGCRTRRRRVHRWRSHTGQAARQPLRTPGGPAGGSPEYRETCCRVIRRSQRTATVPAHP